MAPEDSASLALRELVHEMELDLLALEEHAAEVARGRSTGGVGDPDRAWMAYMAVHMDRFYTAAESAFERVARTLDERLPSGEHWHQMLLHQMTLAIQDVRPALIGAQTHDCLVPLLRFRHWLRHAYRVPFDWSKMRPTVESAPAALERLRGDLTTFLQWLEAAARGGE